MSDRLPNGDARGESTSGPACPPRDRRRVGVLGGPHAARARESAERDRCGAAETDFRALALPSFATLSLRIACLARLRFAVSLQSLMFSVLSYSPEQSFGNE